MAKDIKRSIRDKYNRRLRDLYYALEQYKIFAEDRLNESVAGKIRNKKETEEILEKSKQLLSIVPEPTLHEIDFDKLFDPENDQTEEIMKRGKEFLDSLTEEDWKELRNYKDE